jgi:BirA family biotin operon repressor/biotin-[acetyl-CoA-carboxylase] ligase
MENFATNNWHEEYALLSFDIVDSTNAEAKRLVQSGVNEPLVVLAREQYAGRGRYHRTWISESGNLYLSVLIKLPLESKDSHQLTFVASLAVSEAIQMLLGDGHDIGHKWPNDIFVDGKKVSGILLESCIRSNNNYIDWVVIGVGINANVSPDLANARTNATSLAEVVGQEIDIRILVDLFMKNFHYYWHLWLNEGFALIRGVWLKKVIYLGEKIMINHPSKKIEGILDNVNDAGNAEILTDDGNVVTVASGELFPTNNV